MNKFVKSIDKQHIVQEFITSINGFLKLSNRELECIVLFTMLEMGWRPELKGQPKNTLCKAHRAHVMKSMSINADGLSNLIKRLKSKNLIIVTGNERSHVNPALIPDIINDKVQLVIIFRLAVETSKEMKDDKGTTD